MARRLLFGGLFIVFGVFAGPLSAARAAPSLSIQAPAQGSVIGESKPLIAGQSSDSADAVTVALYAGSTQVESTEVDPELGTGGWSVRFGANLPDGSYRALAEQAEAGTGEVSQAVSEFTVRTSPPAVTLNSISSPTNDASPSFTGSASETTTVTVLIYRGGSPSGEVVASASASGTGGGWSSSDAEPGLADGAYTAVAVQEGSVGNGEGHSTAIHFAVQTRAPQVSLDAVKSPSGQTTPSFSGSASDSTPVSILIYEGGHASGSVVSGAAATGTGGAFSSGHSSPALSSGEYTAIAVQESSLLGNPAGVSNEVTFVVDTSSPVVTLNAVPSPTNDATPSFSGTASDTPTVVVHVFNSSSQEVATATGSPSGGGWSAGTVSKALGTGNYTAIATETSSLGNPGGTSNSIGFTVNTESPHVTLNQPAARSSTTTPTFSGTGSDMTTVTVEIKGTSGGATSTSTATASGTGGSWTSGGASPALTTGSYTARAVQSSSLGNSPGVSESRSFEVDTGAPTVTINPPSTPSNQRSPAFSGTASESSPVTVHVLEEGHEIAKLTATRSGGSWSTAPLTPSLAEGHHVYKVYASEESTLGNGRGESEQVPFVVDTTSPVVTLAAISTPSKVTAPVFDGTGTDSTPVTVDIYLGASAGGATAATAAATVKSGLWTSTPASPTLASGEYTAIAVQGSSLGNPPGESKPIRFTVNTVPPAVTIEPILTPSNARAPSFSGTAGDTTPVVVHVLQAGHEVASAHSTPTGGKWKTGAVTPELASGETAYTAYATQASSLGNEAGRSAEVAFVVDTNPPAVTIEALPTPSNNSAPSFSGTASDTSTVKVKISGAGRTFETAATPSAGSWVTPTVSLGVKTATPFTAVATQTSTIGNSPGESKTIKFTVDPGAPSIAMTVPGPGAQIDTPTPAFSGSAGGTSPITVAICRRSTECQAEHGEWSAKSAAGGAWTATLSTPLEDGEYQAVASERSVGGNLGATAARSFTVDTSAPSIDITTPTAGATSDGGSLLVAGDAGTAAHDHPEVTVQLFAGSDIAAGALPVQPSIVVPVTAGNWSATLGAIAPGTYTLRALQSDEAGNVGTSAPVTFTEDGAAPAGSGPAAAFSWFPRAPHVGETISLVSSSTDEASPITAYSWNLRGSAFSAGTQTQTVSFATPGGHVVQLQVSDAAGRRSLSSQLIPVTYPLMRPFPTVRIVGTRSRGKVRLKILNVVAPRGASVTVTCTGRGCPLKSQARIVPAPKSKTSAAPTLAFTRFERLLPAGVSLVVRVTHAGELGKYTRFSVRRGKLPVRADSCLDGTEAKPVSCGS